MSSKTTNLGLIKPSQNDYFDIDVLNENMDKIDAKIKELESIMVNNAIGGSLGVKKFEITQNLVNNSSATGITTTKLQDIIPKDLNRILGVMGIYKSNSSGAHANFEIYGNPNRTDLIVQFSATSSEPTSCLHTFPIRNPAEDFKPSTNYAYSINGANISGGSLNGDLIRAYSYFLWNISTMILTGMWGVDGNLLRSYESPILSVSIAGNTSGSCVLDFLYV